jgi:hypothetical protein
MATTMFQTKEERFAYDPQVSEANVDEEQRFVYDPKVLEANEEYEDWVHDQNMDAECDMVDYHTGKNRKMAQNVRDKKLTKPKQDETQKELYKQKLKEMEAAKQLKIQKNKERRAEDNLRILERKDKQVVKDIGLDENQYDKDNFGDIDSCLVKDNWDDDLCDEDY